MQENKLPFKIMGGPTDMNSGKETAVRKIEAKSIYGDFRKMVLKEQKQVALADDKVMQRLKELYMFMKQDPLFGKFVAETSFIKAQNNLDQPPKAFLVQNYIHGKTVGDYSDNEIYGDKKLASELLDFVKAAIAILQKTQRNPERMPDFYANKKRLLGHYLHNPRYSGNILIADKAADLQQRVFLVDSGTLFGPGHNVTLMKKLRRPFGNKVQIYQLKRWKRKLEQALAK